MPTSEAQSYARGAVVVVPFPFTDSDTRKRRPALVFSNETLTEAGFYWLAMITGADNPAMPYDVAVPDHRAIGLAIPSVVRTVKIVCLEPILISRSVGQIDDATMAHVMKNIRERIV